MPRNAKVSSKTGPLVKPRKRSAAQGKVAKPLPGAKTGKASAARPRSARPGLGAGKGASA